MSEQLIVYGTIKHGEVKPDGSVVQHEFHDGDVFPFTDPKTVNPLKAVGALRTAEDYALQRASDGDAQAVAQLVEERAQLQEHVSQRDQRIAELEQLLEQERQARAKETKGGAKTEQP